MKHLRHFRARFAVSASEGHGQRALDGIGRKAQIPIAARELTTKIETELVCRISGRHRSCSWSSSALKSQPIGTFVLTAAVLYLYLIRTQVGRHGSQQSPERAYALFDCSVSLANHERCLHSGDMRNSQERCRV